MSDYDVVDYSAPGTTSESQSPSQYSYTPPDYSSGGDTTPQYSYEPASSSYSEPGSSSLSPTMRLINAMKYWDNEKRVEMGLDPIRTETPYRGDTAKESGQSAANAIGTLRSGIGSFGSLGGGYSSGGSLRNRGIINKTMPTMEGPYTFEPTQFNLPVYDKGRIEALREQAMEPGVRRLRDIAYAGQQRLASEDINIQKEGLRSIMRGYGEGLGSVALGARRESLAQYGEEYKPQLAKAMAGYNEEIKRKEAEFDWKNKRALAIYSAALKDYYTM